MASVGHISEIKNNIKTYWNTGIDPNNKFKANYVVSDDKKEVVEKLKEQVDMATKVYICSDPDREGEAIAWSLKKFLKIPEDKYERVTFHEITKNAVLTAFKNPRKIDDDLVKASQARQKLDKICGYRLSPIAKRQVQAKSVGRCQSAGLKLIVDREKEIQDFKPEEYAELTLTFTKNKNEFKAKYFGTDEGEIKRPSYDYCSSVIDDCVANFPFSVSDVETKEKLSNPKAPFTTSTFQQEVSNKLGISVKTAMSYAQKLFEGIEIAGKHIALITYIRTDSPELAPEFLPVLEDYVKKTYGDKYYEPVRKAKKQENAQEGHEAIRVVDLDMTADELSNYIVDEKLLKVYDIIYRRTVACAMKPSITSETIYHIKNGKHIFNLVSKELIFDGYTKVYAYKEKDDEEVVKETFSKGELIDKSNSPSLDIEKKQTTPPARYKEATFIKELENKGIGRPSTFATIVETVLSDTRGYCTVEDKCIVPTDKGIQLSEFLDKSFPDIISINYTSEMEKDLDLIANGKLDDIDFLTSFYNKLESSVKEVAPAEKVKAETTDKICPECGKPLLKRYSPKTGKYFLGCSGYPKCKHIENIE